MIHPTISQMKDLRSEVRGQRSEVTSASLPASTLLSCSWESAAKACVLSDINGGVPTVSMAHAGIHQDASTRRLPVAGTPGCALVS